MGNSNNPICSTVPAAAAAATTAAAALAAAAAAAHVVGHVVVGPIYFTLPLTLGESLSLDLDFLQVPS